MERTLLSLALALFGALGFLVVIRLIVPLVQRLAAW